MQVLVKLDRNNTATLAWVNEGNEVTDKLTKNGTKIETETTTWRHAEDHLLN